jgi:hypothetical protein
MNQAGCTLFLTYEWTQKEKQSSIASAMITQSKQLRQPHGKTITFLSEERQGHL